MKILAERGIRKGYFIGSNSQAPYIASPRTINFKKVFTKSTDYGITFF